MVEAGASVAETEVEPVRHVPWITALEQLRPGGAPVACPVLPGQAGVGGEAESGREGPVGGEPLRAHPAPTPVSPVCPGSGWALLATTPTSDTSVCPTRVDTDSPLHCQPVLYFSPSVFFAATPSPHAITLSFCLWLSLFPLSSLLSSPLGFCSSLPPCHSLHLGPELPSLSCLVTPSPCLSVGASPPTVTATPLSLIFSYPSPRCPWPVPLAPSQPLSLSSFLAPRHWESQRSLSKSEAHWWLLGAQNRGLPTPPPTRPRYEAGRGREVVVCLARRKCLCCGLVTPTP